MDDDSNKLFLLEFVVRRVQVQKSLCCEHYSDEVWNLGQMWVVFQIPNCPPIEICETDYCASDKFPTFNTAKSVLFGLSNELLTDVSDFCIDVGVLKRLPEGVLPDQIFIGHATVNLTNEFNSIMDGLINSPCSLPESREVEHHIVINGHKAVGTISVLVRFTCFGTMVVSKFEQDLKSYERANGNDACPGKKAPECVRRDGAGTPCWNDRKNSGDYNLMPSADCSPSSAGANPPELKENVQVGPNDCKDYEEIEAVMNGHGFTIRVPKCMRRPKFDEGCKSETHEDKDCSCKSKTGGGGGHGIYAREGEDGNFFVQIPGDCKPCGTGEKRHGKHGGPEPCYVIKRSYSQGNTLAVSNTALKSPLNVPKDACLVRISKKNRTSHERTQYLFELQTPEEVKEPPPKETNTKETQYLESDLPHEHAAGDGKKEKEKKGKKGKGKGKGKGKSKKGKKK